MHVSHLDHLVLTVRDIGATVAFYTQALGVEARTFGDDRTALHFGSQKINLHMAGDEIEPKALHPTPGSADLCFITTTPLEAFVAHLDGMSIAIESGPVERIGATGSLRSIYIRDPDFNLIEVANAQ